MQLEQIERLLSEVKAGRVLSAKNETSLREARALIQSVLAELDGKGRKYDPDQPRDESGRFGSGGGGGSDSEESPEAAGDGATTESTPPAAPSPGTIPISQKMVDDMRGGSAEAHLVQNPDGTYSFTPERQALHDEIVNRALAGIPPSANPTFYVMGGGPAAGKSSMLAAGSVNVPPHGEEAGQDARAVLVNADEVKGQIPEYAEMLSGDQAKAAAAFAHEESSYVAKRIQQAAFEGKQDVVLDGTGDSSVASVNGKITNARENGYRVVGNYATVPTDVAVERAAARGERTGRHVPETVIRSTHRDVSKVFPQVAGSFDEVNLWDTSSREPQLLARGGNGSLTIENEAGWQAFLAKGDEA